MDDQDKHQMKNLVSIEKNNNRIVAVENREKFINISYNKRQSFFMNSTDFIKFIKSTEQLIRRSKEYASYIAYLKEDVGLHQCVIFGNVTDDVAKIEMHHGPIFTLYDYVEIQIAHLFKSGEPINSSNVAYHVLRDHFDNIIQVVMLSEAAHQAVHKFKNESKYFVSIDSAWGDITKFLTVYANDINLTHIQKVKKYLSDYKRFSNNDERFQNHEAIFKEKIKKWDVIPKVNTDTVLNKE